MYIVWLEGFGQLKNPVTSSGIKPMTFHTSILLTWLDGFWTYRRNAVADEFLLAVNLPLGQSAP
jgi:hypothetical protein